MNIGETVSKLRATKQWSIRGLAKRAGCSPTTVMHLEQGRINNPTVGVLRGMADAFGVPTAMLIGSDKAKIPANLTAAISAVQDIWQQAYERGYRDGLAKGKTDGG